MSEKLPAFRDENNTVEHLCALAVEAVDKLNVELDCRFSEFNSTLWKSYEILMPCNNQSFLLNNSKANVAFFVVC